VAATEVSVQEEEAKRLGEALEVMNGRLRMAIGSRQAEEEAWALAAAVVAHQEKEVLEVAEDAARQAVALLQAQSVDIATVESTVGPFTRAKEPPGSLFTRALDAPDEPTSFFGRRKRVLGADGGDPMTMLPARGPRR
jgi:hypothetical protein